MLLRLQKFLSENGIASRRKAEEFIAAGHVKVNGKQAMLGNKIDPDKDTVTVFGKPVQTSQDKIYLALNKPKGYVVSKSDPQHRRTVFSLLPKEIADKVWNIGRLDFNTEGLLLLTNDGELTQKLAHPSFEHEKEYEVEVNLLPTGEQLDALRSGVEIATGLTAAAKVKASGKKIRITIHEGKKRQIRRMIKAVGLNVRNLKRLRMGKLRLPDIPPGQYLEIDKNDIL